MEKKKAVIYSMVALIALVILIVGATYAYFQNQYGSASLQIKKHSHKEKVIELVQHLLELPFKQITKLILQLQIIMFI